MESKATRRISLVLLIFLVVGSVYSRNKVERAYDNLSYYSQSYTNSLEELEGTHVLGEELARIISLNDYVHKLQRNLYRDILIFFLNLAFCLVFLWRVIESFTEEYKNHGNVWKK